jgi:hypothetical protein
MRTLSRLSACAAIACAAPSLGSDYAFFFTVSNEVSPENPSTTVTLRASFAPQWYAFGLSKPEIWSGGSGDFSNPEVLIQQKFYCYAGNVAPDGDSVTGTYLQQYQMLLGQFADTHNPLELWSVTWTTDDFSRRDVPIWTKSYDFWVYLDGWGAGENFYGPDFSEGQALITVRSGCYPDLDASGALDLFDFLAFTNLFNAHDPAADCDASGSLDLFDFLCFTNAFNAGC